jgi:hypothetical protein
MCAGYAQQESKSSVLMLQSSPACNLVGEREAQVHEERQLLRAGRVSLLQRHSHPGCWIEREREKKKRPDEERERESQWSLSFHVVVRSHHTDETQNGFSQPKGFLFSFSFFLVYPLNTFYLTAIHLVNQVYKQIIGLIIDDGKHIPPRRYGVLGASPEYFVQMSNVIASSIRSKWLNQQPQQHDKTTTHYHLFHLFFFWGFVCFTTSAFYIRQFPQPFYCFPIREKQLHGQSHCPHWRTFCRLLLTSFIKTKTKNSWVEGKGGGGRLFPKNTCVNNIIVDRN